MPHRDFGEVNTMIERLLSTIEVGPEYLYKLTDGIDGEFTHSAVWLSLKKQVAAIREEMKK